jgi:hypothetical protein
MQHQEQSRLGQETINMKILIIFLFLYINSFAQIYLWEDKTVGNAVDLDGSTEYMSVTPAAGSLDLNGSERITNTSDKTFETSVGNWTAGGNHSIARSSTDKHAGTYSCTLTSSAAGNAITNYMSLPAIAFTSLIAGEKYTLEIWARATNPNCKITVVIGGQSKQSATLSNTAGTFTKVVWNFQATANEVNQPIKLYNNQADVVYLDDVSITQAFDCLINIWHKGNAFNSHGSAWNCLLSTGGGISEDGKWGLYYQSSQLFYFEIDNQTSGRGLQVTTTYSTNQSNYCLVTVSLSRLDNCILYSNGVQIGSGSIANIGKLTTTIVGVGYDGINTSRSCAGRIGEIQIAKFTDISKSNINPLTIFKNGISKGYAGGTVVAQYKFKGTTTADFLRDWSGTGNNLSGTNIDINDKVKGSAPYFQR